MDAPDVPVGLIVAPAGYGKTTLLADWSTHDERPFVWVTLDADDNDPRALLAAIAAALDAVEPVGWEVFEALASPRADAVKVALRWLVRRLNEREVPVVLAIDQVDVLRSRASQQVLTAVWRAAGAGVQVALASRSEGPLPVARLRALGKSVEIRVEDLAMTRSEAAELLRLAGARLDPEQALALTRTTEGWPTGLYLAALFLNREAGAPDVQRFSGDVRFVADYVEEEVLGGLDGAELDFLIRTSVLDSLSGPLCDTVLRRGDSAEMLSRLERENVLMVPLDRRAGTYRYHGLFAGVLRACLQRREPGEAAVLHRHASDWWALQGDTARAIEHAIAAGDSRLAGGLLWDSAVHYAARGEQRLVLKWLSRFRDQEMADTPLLALVAAGTSLVGGDLYEAQRWTSLARTVRDDTSAVRGGLALMRAAAGRHTMAEVGADAAEAQGLLGEGSLWRPMCLLLRGVALHLGGEGGDRGRGQLEEGAHLAAVPAPLVQALCLGQLAIAVAEAEDLDRARVLAGRAMAQVGRCSLEDAPMAALVLAVSAEVAARDGQMAEATTHLRHALRLLARITDPSPWYEAECELLAARASLLVGDSAAADAHLGRAARTVRFIPDAPVLSAWLAAAASRLDLVKAASDGSEWLLTTAELRVLRYLPSHLSFREIAERLYVSPNTVKTHARGIYRKLGVSSRGHAVDRARAAGLVQTGFD